MSSTLHALKRGPIGLGVGLLIAGYALLLLPTLYSLAGHEWTKDTGAHGPIILATGGWLLWRQARGWVAPAPIAGRTGAAGGVLALALGVYAFGRAYDFLTLEAAGVYGAGLALLYGRFGLRPMVQGWFPLAFLGFAVPTPHFLIDAMTAPLKLFVTMVATKGLAAVGLPVARYGVTIVVGQYQLLVEDACSGLNSLIGLTAVSLLYIYLSRGSSLIHSAIMVAFIVPVAIAANVLRIALLVLLTYFAGDGVAQGFSHFAAGILLFTTALLMIYALNQGVVALLSRRRAP